MVAIGLAMNNVAQAQDLQAAPLSGGESFLGGISGLVVDETLTKAGRDFYEVFYSQWEAPATELDYTIFIKELPAPGRGSQVMVYLDETELFNQPLQPRYDVIEAVAQYAVGLVSGYVNNYERMSQQLGNEDQQGSGIFR